MKLQGALVPRQDWAETGYREVSSEVGGTGAATTLPLDEEQKAALAEREKAPPPLGFAPPAPPREKGRKR